jgi:hypothetical protein
MCLMLASREHSSSFMWNTFVDASSLLFIALLALTILGESFFFLKDFRGDLVPLLVLALVSLLFFINQKRKSQRDNE